MTEQQILEQARAAGAKYLYYMDKNVVIGTPETVPPTAVPQNVICFGVQQFTEFVQQLLDQQIMASEKGPSPADIAHAAILERDKARVLQQQNAWEQLYGGTPAIKKQSKENQSE